MKSAKKFIAAIVAGLAVSATAVTAHAANAYPNTYRFHLSDRGGHTFSNYVEKDNNRTYAQVEAKTGEVSDEAYAYLTVYKNQTYTSGAVSNSQKVVELNRDFSLSYKNPNQVQSGSRLCLCFSVGYYGAEVNGSWQP